MRAVLSKGESGDDPYVDRHHWFRQSREGQGTCLPPVVAGFPQICDLFGGVSISSGLAGDYSPPGVKKASEIA
jgi:hypothetical protein